MTRNNVQTTVHVGMDVQLAKRNAEALKEVIATLKKELKEARTLLENPGTTAEFDRATEAVKRLTLQIQTLQKVQKSATPAAAYEGYISGDAMNSNTLRQAQRGAKNRLNTVRTDEGDAAARQFINDTNAIQKQLNRLQAGFTSPFRSIKQELNSLSGGELQRLHQLLQQEQPLVQGNEKAWANYSAAIAKVEQRMREYDTEARQQMGASTLSKAQSGGFATANERDMQRAIDKLKEYRAVINDPNGSGKATYEATNAEIQKLQANLDVLKQKELEATGQSMSRASALQIGMQTLNGTFTGTTQQLNLAKQALEANMLTVQRGGAEYNAMRQALNGIELELKNVGTLSKEVQAVLDQPKGKSFNALKQAVEQGRLALNAMDRSTKEGQKAFDELAAKVKAADIEMKNLGNSSKGTASAFDKAWSRLKTYVGLYVGAAVAMQKLSQAMGDLLTLSDKMGEVRKTTGFTADEVGRLSNNLAKLDTRTSLTQLMELSSLAGSVGLKTQEQVQGFTEAADQLIVALPELGNESARTIIKIANATGDLEKNGGNVRETLEKVGSTIIALRANSASAAGPITDFMSRVGAVGAQAGISIDQIAALGSTIDALGGRVEMSATALSRMIPAIKNNSFAIANSIGVTQEYLKSLAPMEQMVLIFQKMRDNIQHIDTSTEQGQEQMAQTIEGMLGRNATMREVMKDLEQQGARAGIVFGLLSQNVDELEKQLGIASEAYRENTALMNEYNNMNETTAAKWERLKNQFEEAFVGDSAQRRLGWIIDRLRELVDLLTGDGGVSVALRAIIVYLSLAKLKIVSIAKGALASLGNGLKNIGIMLGFIKGEMTALQWGNIFTATAGAILLVADAMGAFKKKVSEAEKALNAVEDAERNAKKESIDQRAELDKLYKATQDQNKSLDERKKALRDMVGDEKYKKYYENISSESEFAKAAARAYDDLAASIMATARARAYEEKATELQRKRMNLELEKEEAEERRKEAQGRVLKESLRTSLVGAQANQRLGTPGMRAMATGMSRESQDLHQAKADVKKEDAAIESLEADITLVDTAIGRLEASVDELKIGTSTGTGDGDGSGGNGGGGGSNPYGTYNRVTSPYQEWDADALVSRRKEMLERVRALANGADVQAVLSEDAKFITEATRKNIKTTKQAIEWYNTERLKIQDALHERYLTNTGDWMDSTKQKARAKVIKDEWSAYLNELDAYYTERKAKIQEQQNDEEISEAEARNRTLANEAEWRQRRAELQKLYARKSAEVTEEEQQAIFKIIGERTGDSADFIQATIGKTVKFIYDIGKHSEKEMRTIFGKLDKGIEQDLLRQRNAIGQHMKDITAIINKENPYAGITEELRKNLGTMDALLTDIEKDEERTVEKEIERTMFILEQSTKGYALTWEELMREMAKRGWQAWADAVNGDTQTRERLMHQVYRVFEQVQDAIKKEASQLKKDAENMWNNILLPGGDGKTTIKDAFEQTIGALGIEEGRVSRANSLIGAGQASERVADRLAIQQMKVQLAMQQYQYSLVRKIGREKIESLRKEAREAEVIGDIEKARQLRMQAQNAEMALNLATRKEQTEELKQQEAIIAKTEESEARLYKELKKWADLLTSSLQSMFEASHTGDADYYNELAKLNLTGNGGPGAGTYIVIDNEGTSDATAHYEYLDEREALERQHEIERENAQAEAWKKVMDDINMKMSETITDQLNAMLQNASLDANTQAVGVNTDATNSLTGAITNLAGVITAKGLEGENKSGASERSFYSPPEIDEDDPSTWPRAMRKRAGLPVDENAHDHTNRESTTSPVFLNTEEQGGWTWIYEEDAAAAEAAAERKVLASEKVEEALRRQFHTQTEGSTNANQKTQTSTQSMFAKMTKAANMYGIAYQAMSNDNLSTTQKFEMMALQAVGNYAIGALTSEMAAADAKAGADSPGVLGTLWKQLGWAAAPVFAIFTGLLGGLMGLASSKIGKAKSTIAQVTGASSASAGRLSTGMLTYAEGNVNEFTDPSTLREGRQYNVDAADGRTYRARYMGRNPKTHLTNGPEFHLSGERGREMIIDAGTTRQITTNEGEIWHAIQTLSGGGRISALRSRVRGVAAFADGNVEDFIDGSVSGDSVAGMSGMSAEQAASLQVSIDRQSDLLERALTEGIRGVFNVHGPDGLVASYDKGKKTALRHGERY